MSRCEKREIIRKHLFELECAGEMSTIGRKFCLSRDFADLYDLGFAEMGGDDITDFVGDLIERG